MLSRLMNSSGASARCGAGAAYGVRTMRSVFVLIVRRGEAQQ
jgi:hypothetical protein